MCIFKGREARKVRECFLPEVNLLNDATEKLAQVLTKFLKHSQIWHFGLWIFAHVGIPSMRLCTFSMAPTRNTNALDKR